MSSYSTYNDAQLADLLKDSNEAAFAELYSRYWDRLLYQADMKLHNLSIAEELVQDVFLDIWNRRETIVFNGPIGAYLGISLKHKVINAQAKILRDFRYRQYAARHLPMQEHSTENLLEFEEAKDRLAKLVAALPEKSRMSFELSREQGLTRKEIADKLNISEKAVENNLTRALKQLRAGLGHFLFFLLVLTYFMLLSFPF